MKRIAIMILALALSSSAWARITLSPLFGDSMVLQRESKVKIWGNSDSGGKVSLITSWNGKIHFCQPAPNGNWMVEVETGEAGGPFTITVDDGERLEIKDVRLGEVWICCGQSNMEMTIKGFPNQPVRDAADYVLDASDYDIHVFTLKRSASNDPVSSVSGEWKASTYANVPGFSATAYLFARRIQKSLGVPVGVIVSAWGGSSILAWMPSPAIGKSISEKEKSAVLALCNTAKDQPSVLFNGMIAPIAGYGAKGFLWYQGEANVGTPDIYGKMLKEMVHSWREAWGDRKNAMPFYAVEIAPYRYGRMCELKYDRPLTVEATVKALNSISNAAVAPTGDIGDAVVIHPAFKKEVGDRLAMYALKNQYGFKALLCTPPAYSKIEYKEGTAVLSVDSDNIPVTGAVAGFEIAGDDECYYVAKAVVDRKNGKIVLSNPNVTKAVAVRYGFRNFNRQDWKNWMGIPALPFRTDNWDYSKQ